MLRSDQVFNFRGELRPRIADLAPDDVLRHGPEAALVELLRPVGEADPVLEGAEPLGAHLGAGEVLGDHGDGHGEAHQFPLVRLHKGGAGGRVDEAAVDGARVEEDEVAGPALEQLSLPDVGVGGRELEPVAATERGELVAAGELVLRAVVVGARDHLQPARPVAAHVDERHHALHAVKAALGEGVLVAVEVLDEGRPAGLRELAPPGPPADEGVEAGDELGGAPDAGEGGLHARMGADEPGGVRVAAAVGDAEADGAAAWPVLVLPGRGVVPAHAAAQRLHPLPEEIGRPPHLFLREHAAKHHRAVLVQVRHPLLLLLHLESIIL